MLQYKKETNCTSTCVKLGKLLTEEIMYSAVSHIGVWVRASEQADDEGEVGHLIISIISLYLYLYHHHHHHGCDLVHCGHQEPEEDHQPALGGAASLTRHCVPRVGDTSLFRAHSPDPIFTMRPILGYRLFPKFKDIVMN